MNIMRTCRCDARSSHQHFSSLLRREDLTLHALSDGRGAERLKSASSRAELSLPATKLLTLHTRECRLPGQGLLIYVTKTSAEAARREGGTTKTGQERVLGASSGRRSEAMTTRIEAEMTKDSNEAIETETESGPGPRSRMRRCPKHQ